MARIATVHRPTLGIGPSGHGITVQPGTYPIAELDGVSDQHPYIEAPDGTLVAQIRAADPNITISGTAGGDGDR